MILDERLEFSDFKSAAYGIGNRIFGDVIDLGAESPRDIGSGQPLYLVINTQSAITGAGNVTFDLLSDSTVDLATSATTHYTTGALVYTTYTTGHSIVVALPQETTYERYLGMWITTSGTTTGGAVGVFLTQDPSKYTSYNDGI